MSHDGGARPSGQRLLAHSWVASCWRASRRRRRPPSCRRPRPIRASGSRPGLENAGSRRGSSLAAPGATGRSRTAASTARIRTSPSRATTRSSATSTASTSTTSSNPAAPTLQDRRRLPGRPERRVGLREPAVHVGRGDPREEGLRARRRRPTPTTRFRGVRIFDISNIDAPGAGRPASRPAAARTRTRWCVRRTTRTTSTSTSPARPACAPSDRARGLRRQQHQRPTGANPSQWRIEVIKVPLAAPTTAAVVNEPRLFKQRATGAVNGLQNGPTPQHRAHGTPLGGTGLRGRLVADDHRTPATTSRSTRQFDLAAGACEGNGLLIDISDPANPKRIDAVADPLFAYWHGATFSNDGKAVVFTDEWGGGTRRALPRDRPAELGRERDLRDRQPQARVPQLLQAAGGADRRRRTASATSATWSRSRAATCLSRPGTRAASSVVDFTDLRQAEGDRLLRPRPGQRRRTLVSGGFWSTYWYNGRIYGSEIARGFDSFKLTPTADLTAGEIASAERVPQPSA